MGDATLTWLHLSDLHRCSTRHDGAVEIVLERLIEDLQSLIESEGLKPDLLFFTGDAAFGQLPEKSLKDQFFEAWEWFERVRELCGLETERVFLVPGNHDIDRGRINPAIRDWLREKSRTGREVNDLLHKGGENLADHLRRLGQFRDFLESAYPHLVQDRERLIFVHKVEVAGLRVGIAGFNSAWSCGEDDEKGHLWLGADYQMGELVSRLPSDCDLSIALMHHPPTWLRETEDPGTLRSRLQEHFRVFLHGHEHAMWVETPQARHLKIAAGAVHDREGATPFGFNVLRWNLATGSEPTGDLWLRHFDQRVDRWGGDSIPGHTDSRGVWPLEWPGRPLPERGKPGTPVEVVPAVVEEPADREPTAAERLGLFGREDDLRKAHKALAASRFLWLHGLSGIGKSVMIGVLASVDGREERQVRLRKGMAFEEIYAAFSLELGCREPSPKPVGVMGALDFKPFEEWGRNLLRPRLVHIEGGDSLIERTDRAKIVQMFAEAVKRVPLAELVVESQQKPPESTDFTAQQLKGLEVACLGTFFRRPLPARPEVGWELSQDELDQVAVHVAGDKAKRKNLHPLALFLLVQVAADLRLRPPMVFKAYEDRFRQELKKGLFDILYDQVLDSGERHMLRLCALYRELTLIPERHLEVLAARVGDEGAFGTLVRRAILDRSGESYHLHSLLRQLTASRADAEAVVEDHRAVATAWLESVRYKKRFDITDLNASNEAFYHLEQSESFLEMGELEARFLRLDVPQRLEEISRRLSDGKRDREARSVLELWSRVEPQNPKPFRFLGEILSRLEGRGATSALKCFEKAIELMPDMPQYWSGYGTCLLARSEGKVFLERLDGLAPSLRTSLLANNFVADVRNQCLANLGSQGAVEAATLREQRLVSGSASLADYANQAKWLLSHGKPEEALRVLDQARERGVEDAYMLSLRDDVLEDLGHGVEAAAFRAQRLASGSRNPVDYNNQAKWLRSQKKPEEALRVLDQARERGVEDAYSLSLRDDVLEDLGHGVEAAALRAQRLASGSRDPVDYNNQAKWLRSQKRPEEALRVLDQARERGVEDNYIIMLRRVIQEDLVRLRSPGTARSGPLDRGSSPEDTK